VDPRGAEGEGDESPTMHGGPSMTPMPFVARNLMTELVRAGRRYPRLVPYLWVFIVIACLIAAGGCSRSGDLSGNVFVTMKSGDVKRAAGIQVVLVHATDQFQGDWKKLVGEFTAEYKKADAGYQDANKAMRESYSTYAGEKSMEWAKYVDRVVDTYRARAKELIAKTQMTSGTTDVNGGYAFQDIPAGRYFLFVEYQVFDNQFYWMTPVEVNSRSQKLDLSNGNQGWPFTYLR
jgi:hypothetical protein